MNEGVINFRYILHVSRCLQTKLCLLFHIVLFSMFVYMNWCTFVLHLFHLHGHLFCFVYICNISSSVWKIWITSNCVVSFISEILILKKKNYVYFTSTKLSVSYHIKGSHMKWKMEYKLKIHHHKPQNKPFEDIQNKLNLNFELPLPLSEKHSIRRLLD